MFFYTLLAIAVALIFGFLKYRANYWKRLGFPQDEDSLFLFGCLKPVIMREKSFGMCIYDMYRKTKEPFVGIYLLYQPGLFVKDLDIARQILVEDFSSFHDRGIYDGGEKDPLRSHLLSQKGAVWRSMRTKLSSSFTSGKLKTMFSISSNVADRMIDHLKSIVPESGSKEVDIKNIYKTYTTDIIASVIFGLDIDGFKNPNNEFIYIVEELTKDSLVNALTNATVFLCPSLAEWFFALGFQKKGYLKLKNIVERTIKMRKENGIVRKDILQCLALLQQNGKLDDDDTNWSLTSDKFSTDFTLDNITAQSFIFYMAGQVTTAATSFFTICELAQQPTIYEKVQEEMSTVLKKYNGEITYDSLQEMKYLDLCIQETLRLYPGLPVLNRQCTKDCVIQGTDKVIKVGTNISISLYGIQRDPKHFPKPDEYIPERFLESPPKYNPRAYMPFGDGPRSCIAARMGKTNAKLGVLKLLNAFNIEPLEKQNLDYETQTVTLEPKGNLGMKLYRKHNSYT